MRGVLGLSKLMSLSSSADGATDDRTLDPRGGPKPVNESRGGGGGDTSDPRSSLSNTALLTPAHVARSQGLRGALEGALDQMQHARSQADQIAELLADYDAKAQLSASLGARNEELTRLVEEERFKTADLATRKNELEREVARAQDEAMRAQEVAEATRSEVSELQMTRQREVDRSTQLSSQISLLKGEVDNLREALSRAEIESSGLRAALVERDHALTAMQNKESEWRLRGEKDASQLADMEQASERKERRITELSGALEVSAKRIEELEERAERAREEQRQMDMRYNDLNVSSESRIFTLSGSLSQEQAGHRVTRKLLEEMRSQSQSMADENKQLKDQAVNLAQENQQMKRELGGTRGTIREYGERLSELNLRHSAAQDDIERLETTISDTKKETRRLKRRASKVDDLQSENASLLEKIKSLQHTLEQYRAANGPGSDAPIMLTRRRSNADEAAERAATAPVLKMPNA